MSESHNFFGNVPRLSKEEEKEVSEFTEKYFGNLPAPPPLPKGDEVTEVLDKIAKERQAECDHGIEFDADAAKDMTVAEIRKRYPRLFGPCPKGCGFDGIGYKSWEHYVMGDW